MFVVRRLTSYVRNNKAFTLIACRKCHAGKVLTEESIWASNHYPKYTEVEEVHGHWHYVERLLASKVAAEPPKKGSVGGWKAPSETAPDLPYYVQRTRNCMLPVYKFVEPEGPRYVTVLKHIQGDIWALEKDLKPYLQEGYTRPLVVAVDEVIGVIKMRGNFVDKIKEWLYAKGF